MTLEEYAVEQLKDLKARKLELETELKIKEKEYNQANAIIRKLKEENDYMKEIICHFGAQSSHNSLQRGGNIYINISDSWKTHDLTEKELKERDMFDFCLDILKAYLEEHPVQKEEEGE